MSTPYPPPHGAAPQPQPQYPHGSPYPHHPAYQQPPAPHPYPGGYPQPGGWVPPPPQRKSPAKIIGIVAAVIAVAVIGGVVLRAVRTATDPWPDPDYRLSIPKTVLGGEYTLTQDMSETFDQAMDGERTGPNERDLKGVAGQYVAGDRTMVVSGSYGQIKDPDRARKSFLKGVAENENSEVAVPARDITPQGTDEVLTCEVLTVANVGEATPVPLCAWSDNGTMAAVMEVDPSTAGSPADSVDLDAFASRAAKVREEVRVPLN